MLHFSSKQTEIFEEKSANLSIEPLQRVSNEKKHQRVEKYSLFNI